MTQENTAPVESKPRKKTFKRILLWTLGILLVLIIVLPLILINYLSPIVKGAVEKFGSQAIGCPVTVEKIDISLLGGSVDIVDFKVGAPQGFKAEPISVHEVFVKVDLGSLLSDTIIVDEIRIDAPQVAYEVGWGKTNVGAILDALQGDAPKEEKKPEVKQEEKAEESGAGKKVCIRKVDVTDGKITLATTILGGGGLPVPLPDIHLTDIGGNPDAEAEPEGTTVAEAISEIFTSIFKQAGEIGAKSFTAAKDALSTAGKKTGEALGNAAEATGKALNNAAEGIKNLFKK